MKRKLVKQGTATLMISLPSKWVKLNNLSKGSEIDIDEIDSNLIIKADSGGGKKKIEVNISSLTESSIRTVITNAYRIGYDEVIIHFSNKNTINIIQDIVDRNLIGFEITKKTDKLCNIESITEPSKEHFNNIFSKVLLNIDELFLIAEKNLSGEKEDFEDIERKIQQFDNFCRRVVSKENFAYDELIWSFHSELIHAQREIYLMLKYLKNNKIKDNKDVKDILSECKKIFDLLKEGYENKDIKSLERVHDFEKDIIYKKGYKLLEKSKDAIVIHHILSAARNFYLASSPLIGFKLIQKN